VASVAAALVVALTVAVVMACMAFSIFLQ